MKILKLIMCGIIFLPLNTVLTMELPEIRKKASELEEKQQKSLNWQLKLAVAHDSLPLVVQLIEEGADINSIDEHLNTTPLYTAIEHNHDAMIRFLIMKGADVQLGRSVLKPAIWRNRLELIQYLIELGAPIADDDYSTALRRGNREIIDYLRSMMPPKRK